MSQSIGRWIALFITFPLTMPGPVFAMRAQAPQEAKEGKSGLAEALRSGNPETAVRALSRQAVQAAGALGLPAASRQPAASTGLEEVSILVASGRPLTEAEEGIVLKSLSVLIQSPSHRRLIQQLAPETKKYRLLDPDGALNQNGVRVFLVPGFNQTIRAHVQDPSADLRQETLIALLRGRIREGLPGDPAGAERIRSVYLDADEANRLGKLKKALRRQFAQYLIRHWDALASNETGAQAEDPSLLLQEVFSALEQLRPVTGLPAVVQEAMWRVPALPEADQRTLGQLIEAGTNTPGEVALAVRASPELGVPAVRILKQANRHRFTVPMELEALGLAKSFHGHVGWIAKWAKQVLAAERGAGPTDPKREELWRQSSMEVQQEALKTTAEFELWWKRYQKDVHGVSDISFKQILQAHAILRNVDQLSDIMEAILEAAVSDGERRRFRWPYAARFGLVLNCLERAQREGADPAAAADDLTTAFSEGDNRYKWWLRDKQHSEMLETLRETGWAEEQEEGWRSGERGGEEAGFEEGIVTATGDSLPVSRQAVLQRRLAALHGAELAGKSEPSLVRELTRAEADRMDPKGILGENGFALFRVDFLNEAIAGSGAERRGLPFLLALQRRKDPRALFASPRQTLYFDSSALAAFGSLPVELREVWAEHLISDRSSAAGADGGIPPRLLRILSALYRGPGHLRTRAADPGLGMNLYRTRGRWTEYDLAPDLWAEGRIRPEHLETVRELAKDLGLNVSPAALTRRMNILLKMLGKHFGFQLKLRVDLVRNQRTPLRLLPPRLRVDATLLALPAGELRTLLAYSLKHLERSDAVAGASRDRIEIATYVEGTQDLLGWTEAKRRQLESAFHRLKAMRWDTEHHRRYLRAIRKVGNDPDLQAWLRPAGLTAMRPWAFRHVAERIRNRLTARVKRKRVFLPARLLGPASWRPLLADDQRALHQGGYILPRAEEVFRLLRILPTLRYAAAEALLRENEWLLLEGRAGRWEQIEPVLFYHLHLNDPGRVLRALALSGDPLADEMPLVLPPAGSREARREALGYDPNGVELIGALLGIREFQRIVQPLDWTERVRFLAKMEQIGAQGMHVWIEGARPLRRRDGISYLESGEPPAPVIRAFLALQEAAQEETKRGWRKDPGAGPARAWGEVIRILLKQWGVVLGLSVRGEVKTGMKALLETYPRSMQISVKKAEARVAGRGGAPALYEAVLRLKGWYRWGSDQRFLAQSRSLLEKAWPALLTVYPEDPGSEQRLPRVCCAYLLAVRDPPAVRFIIRSLARSLDEEFRGDYRKPPAHWPAHTSAYARRVLAAADALAGAQFENAEDLSAMQGVARHLLYEVSRAQPSARPALAEGLLRALSSNSEATRRAIVAGLYRNPAELRYFLWGAATWGLKQFLADHSVSSDLANVLADQTVEDIRELLAGLPSETTRSILEKMDSYRRRDVAYREIYERLIDQISEEIENPLEGGTLPNHYRTLGIPRGGTAEQLKKRLRASHRRLAFAYHPDRFPNEDEASRRRAQAMIRQIEEAYAVLSDEQQRRAYEYDSKGRNRLPNDSRLYPSSAWYNDPQLTKWLAAPKPTGAKPRGELAGRPADGSSGSAAPTAGLEEKPQAPAAGLARIESLVSEQGGVGRMAPSQLTDVSRRLRELASSPGVDVAMQAQQTRMGYTAELRPPALKAVESSGGTWARPDSSAPPVFVFEGSQAVWAPFVAQAGAPVGVIVDTIYEAEGLKGMLQEIGIPEKQFAVVALDVAGDRDQALQEIQQHFHLPGFPAPQPVTFPAGDSADAIEQALRGYGFSFTNSPTPQLHQVDLYLSSEA